MLICVDLARLRDHMEHPQREVREAERIRESLERLYQQSLDDPTQDPDFYLRELRHIKEEIGNIRRRTALLEQTCDTFSEARAVLSEKVAQLSHRVGSVTR